MSAFLWCLFEETPRPQPLPTFPFPNHHPFSVRCQESLGPLIPVGEGPLSSYHDHILIPVPGELGGPPLWTPVSPAMVGSPAASPATFLESIPTDPQRSKSISPVPNSIPPEPEIIDTFPEPRKTYLSRRARGLPPLQCFSSDVGNQAVTLLSQNLAPERRRKGERRCGRFVCFSDFAFPSLRHKHFLHCPPSRCDSCRAVKCNACKSCKTPSRKQGCLRRSACLGQAQEQNPSLELPASPSNDWGSFGHVITNEKFSPRKSSIGI